MYIGTNYYNYYSDLFNYNSGSIMGKTGNGINATFNSILGTNKSKDYFDSSALKIVQDMKSGSAALKTSLNALTRGLAFKQVPVSSDTDVLTVRTADKFNTSRPKNTSVFVDQVATAQKNEGSALQAQDKAGETG